MSQVANMYAQALYDLAKEEQTEEQLLQQLLVLREAFAAEPDFVRLLSAPNLAKQERCKILDDSFRGKVSGYLLNFLKLLTEKGYMRHFDGCCKAYREIYNRDHGILPVRAVTAVAMTGEQEQKLKAKLEKLTGKQVELECRVDAAVMGGVRLDYDGKCVDGTVKNRLDAVGSLLKNTVL